MSRNIKNSNTIILFDAFYGEISRFLPLYEVLFHNSRIKDYPVNESLILDYLSYAVLFLT